ncbi:MAG: YfhO family protein, partial [Clostridia bacterium]|nr:YfhO family protein [Clostridia bacterium]
MKEKLKDKKEYFILSAIVLVLMLAVFLVGKVFPFGNNSFGCYDFYFQVLDTTASIFHAGGRANLFFTFDLANGWSSFSSLFYACFSPFTVILLLGGIQNIRFLFPLYIFLKFLTISLVALFFIRKYFKSLNSCTQIIFALLYTFGCYGFMSVTWCVWLDLMIYIPLAFIAFDYMQNTGKVRYLALVLALMILTSFSIAIFTTLYSIVIFALYIWLVVPKENRKTICFKTIIAVTIALASTLFMVIPCLIEMMHSTRTGDLFTSIHESKTTKYFWVNFGLLLSSAVPIFLSVMFLFKNKLKTKTGKFYFYLFMLCIIPSLINNINVAINFSAYAGYPLRLGALFNFVFTFMALKYLETRKKQETSERNVKIFFLPLILLCAVTFGVGLLICFIVNQYTGNLSYNFDLNVNLLIPILLFAVTVLTIFLLTKFRKLNKKASKIFYCIIMS